MVYSHNTAVMVDPCGCPIHSDVFTFDFGNLMQCLQRFNINSIDVVYMDPPWAISNPNPYRGIQVGYDCKKSNDILNELRLPWALIS